MATDDVQGMLDAIAALTEERDRLTAQLAALRAEHERLKGTIREASQKLKAYDIDIDIYFPAQEKD